MSAPAPADDGASFVGVTWPEAHRPRVIPDQPPVADHDLDEPIDEEPPYPDSPEGHMPPSDPAVDDAVEAELAFNQAVATEAHRIRVREAARDRILAEKAAVTAAVPFDADLLRDMLTRPAAPPARIEGLIPWDASTLLVAQRKTGKTTFILNWARALLTGEDLLGRFPVRPIRGRVAILNYEVSGHTLSRWADEHHIDPDRFFQVNLRGKRNPLAHPDDQDRLAGLLRQHDVEAVAVDPFGRAYTGKNQNDAGEVTAWLVALDAFIRTDVGATDLLLAAHAGWNGERSRGSTALEDWGDSIIKLTRDSEDESQRFMSAEGRDIDVDEDRLDFDTDTRTLHLAGVGSRKKARDERGLADLAVLVLRAIRANPGIGVAEIERAIKGMDDAPDTLTNGAVSKAAKWARDHGQLTILGGRPGRKSQHFPVDTTTTPPNPSETPPPESPKTPPTPPFSGEVGVGGRSEGQPIRTQEHS